MKVYAIRHIPTGRFMPVPTGKNGSGSSYWDPVDIAFDGEGNVTTVPPLVPTPSIGKFSLDAVAKRPACAGN